MLKRDPKKVNWSRRKIKNKKESKEYIAEKEEKVEE